jgi:hypothetical protein
MASFHESSSSSDVFIELDATTAPASNGFTSEITTNVNTTIPITISIEDYAVAINISKEGIHSTSATDTATTSGIASSPTLSRDASNDQCHKTSSSVPQNGPLTATIDVDLTASPLEHPGTMVERTENTADPGPSTASSLPLQPDLDKFELQGKQEPRWKMFQQKDHSLRVSASEVAALTGFHPFRSLPKVLLEHVYQGHEGHELLLHDASLLDITLTSDAEQLLQLAQLAGPSTSQAVQVALQVKRGTTKLQTSQHASQLQNRILDEAKKSNKLSVAQLKQLQEGTQYSVNTGFGTTWETNAIDVYERQCGWDIYERNGDIRTWPFCKVTDHLTGPPTVIPMAEAAASATCWNSKGGSTNSRSSSLVETISSCKRQKLGNSSSPDEMVVDLTESDDTAITLTNVNDENSLEKKVELGQERKPRAMTPIVLFHPPFFFLRGSVDGIRDELVPNQFLYKAEPLHSSTTGLSSPSIEEGNHDDDDDDSWVLQRIIVECKHRMTRIQPSPPLYEQIQAIAYCLMFEAECADIVQVLRKRGVVRSRYDHPVDDENDRLGQDSQKRGTKLLNSPSKPSNVSSNPLNNYFPMKESQVKDSHIALPPNDRQLTNPQIRTKENADVELDRGTSRNHTENLKMNTSLTNSPVQEAEEAQPADSKELLVSDVNTSESEAKTSVADASGTEPATNKDEENNPKEPRPPPRPTTQLEISVHRVFLDDPVLQHRHNWHQVILPRLRSWVDAVYSIRNNDDKRYRLLLAMSRNDQSGISEAWQHLFEECSWLKGCDTAFLRDTSESAN